MKGKIKGGLLSKVNKNLSGRALLYMIGQLGVSFLSVISAPIFVRLMTTTEYGMAAVFLTWVSIFSKIVGLRTDSTIQNAYTKFGEKNVHAYVSTTSFLALCFFCVVFSICWIFNQPVSHVTGLDTSMLALCLLASFALHCSEVRMAYYRVMRDATGNMVISLILSILQITCSILLLVYIFDDGYIARALGYSVPTIAMGVFFLVLFYTRGKKLISKEYWRFCLGLSIPMIFNGLAYLLINQCDRLMINAMIGPEAAGIYSFAYTCAMPISVVTNALANAWTPELYAFLKSGNDAERWEHSNRYMNNVTCIAIGLMLICPEVLIIFGTEEYYSGIPMLPLIVMAHYFQFLYTWPVNCEFYYMKTKLITGATVVATALNIVLNWFLIPIYGPMAAAATSLVAYACLMVMHDICARIATDGYDYGWVWYLKGIVPVGISMIVTYLLLGNLVARWALAIVAAVWLLVRVVRSKSIL